MTELEFTPINTGEKAGKGTKQSGNEKDIHFCKYSQLAVWFEALFFDFFIQDAPRTDCGRSVGVTSEAETSL